MAAECILLLFLLIIMSHGLRARFSLRYSYSLLHASKHTVARSYRAGESITSEDNLDPKKLEMLKRLGLEDVTADVKTGAELRKDRKVEAKIERERQKRIEKKDSKAKKPQEKVRFTLGNGVESLTADSLVGLVRSTAPYLFPESSERMVMEDDDEDEDTSHATSPSGQRLSHLTAGAQGWRDVLSSPSRMIRASASPSVEERVDYFALCMASHFATVATYVPTDVDSKIRGHCWKDPNPDVLYAQLDVLKHALGWCIEEVSRKAVSVYDEEFDRQMSVSGHNGEWLGVLCGAWGAFLGLGDAQTASLLEETIYSELEREARAFKLLRLTKSSAPSDTLLLKVAAVVTHNVGDVDQGLSYWEGVKEKYPEQFHKFSRLAHERGERFGGEFLIAKALYKELLSAEGHRNYPLREARCLRRSPDFMLPLGPWYERWGRLIATHPGLSEDERVQVARQLLRGCDSSSKAWCVPNQVGYYRAIQGIVSCTGVERLSQLLDKDSRAVLSDHLARSHVSLSEEAFAAKLGKRARLLLDSL